MVKTLGLTHLALTVSDLNRSFQFYHDVFGMLAVYREPHFLQAQTPGARDVLVLEEGGDDVGKSGGIKHFGFRLTDPRDIEKAATTIEQAGGKIKDRGEFVPGDAALVVRAILGSLNWSVQWFKAEGPLTAAQVADGFADYLIRGLLAKPGVFRRNSLAREAVSIARQSASQEQRKRSSAR